MKPILIDVCVTGMMWLSVGGCMDVYLLYRDWWGVINEPK